MMRTAFITSLALLASASTASAITFTTTLSSLNQVPKQESVASGSAIVKLVGDLLSADVKFTSLAGSAPFGHIHCCEGPTGNAPVAVPFVGFPAAATGEYIYTFNLLDRAVYSTDFLSANGGTALGARDALVTGLKAGLSYVNIHDAPAYPAGEIRGQLARSVAVPEPAMLSIFGLGALAMGFGRRRA